MASLGALLSVFFQGFVAKRTQEGPRGGQETSWARFSMVLDRFWEAEMVKKTIFFAICLICFSRFFLVEFCSIFDDFDGGMVKNTFFSIRGCWCFWKGLGRKQDALR